MIKQPELIEFWNRPVPRYTSYPTAPQFIAIEEGRYREKLGQFSKSDKDLSVYIHIPFCKSMCLFCGCSVVLNRSEERQRRYLNYLMREIRMFGGCFGEKRRVTQLHIGGGTPTSLKEEELDLLMGRLKEVFDFTSDVELSIEIDPRTVFADGGEKLAFLRQLGFNRVSFGVQDLDQKVQEAVKRRQSEEMTVKTYEWARALGFGGINLDFIYGLPYQSVGQFADTVKRVVSLKPDRIALFSYAKVPWLKPHQKAIKEETLPSVVEKWEIYREARRLFLENGYVGIGMDHFALQSDPLVSAFQKKKLMRNFQGYSLQLAEDMIGLGMTSIGFIENSYFQNRKKLDEYEGMIENGILPVEKGLILNEEDQRRRWVIESLMCHFEVNKKDFFDRFQIDFDSHFKEAIEKLTAERWIEKNDAQRLMPTETGCLLIRIVASAFDAYLERGKFSKAI